MTVFNDTATAEDLDRKLDVLLDDDHPDGVFQARLAAEDARARYTRMADRVLRSLIEGTPAGFDLEALDAAWDEAKAAAAEYRARVELRDALRNTPRGDGLT